MEFSEIIPNVLKAQLSPDGKYFVVICGNKLIVKLTNKGGISQTENIITLSQTVNQMSFSPDSQYILLVYNKKNIAQAFSVMYLDYQNSGNWNCKIQDQFPGIVNAVWAPDSRQILVFSDFQTRLSIYNLMDKSISHIRGPKFTNKGFAFSQDGKWMALAERRDSKDSIGIYFTKDWTLVNYFQNLDIFDLNDLAWAPNGSFIIAWDNCLNYKLLTICPLKGVINKYQAYKYQLGIKTVRYSHNSFFVAVGSFDEKVRLINALTWRLIGELQFSPVVTITQNMMVLKQEEYKQNSRSFARLVTVDTSSIKLPTVKVVVNQKTYTPPNIGIGMLQFSNDDYYMACRNDNMPNVLWIWDVSKLEIKCLMIFLSPIKGFKWAPEDSSLCIYNGTPKLFFWNPDDSCICDLPFESRAFNVHRMKWTNNQKSILLQDKSQALICHSIGGFRSS